MSLTYAERLARTHMLVVFTVGLVMFQVSWIELLRRIQKRGQRPPIRPLDIYCHIQIKIYAIDQFS